MLDHFNEYGYQGVFLALIAASFGFPIPEELPVLTAGVMVGHEDTTLKWYIMLPVVMAGVVIGDGVLYGLGRLWGRKLLNWGFIRRNFVPLDKQEQIEKNFAERGIWVLLGARLLPGIRAPVFIMAGVLKVPFGRFMLADAIYAIPLVNILFWLAYMLTDQVLVIFNKIDEHRPLVIVAILSGITGALIHKYIFSRHVSTGEAPHVPDIIAKPAVAVGHAVEKVVEKVTGRHHDKPHDEATPDGAAEQEFGIRTQEPTTEKPPGEVKLTSSSDGEKIQTPCDGKPNATGEKENATEPISREKNGP
jgi:membrane protein DedA with SNARE-associated domain